MSVSFAEYVSAPESALALKPSNVSFEEAAAVPVAAVTALQGLRDQGIYVVTGGSVLQFLQAALQGRQTSKTGNKKTHVASLVQSQTDLIFIKELLETGKITPVVDGCYPLSQTPEAFWYFEKVHHKGKVVISVV